MSLTPWTRQEEWYQQIINASTGKYLPSVSAQDAGKVLAVGSDGGWVAQGYLELSGTVADGAITITTSPLPSIDDVADAYKSGKGVLIHFPTANILLVPFYSEATQGFDSYTFSGTGADYDGFKFRATVIFSNSGGSWVCYGTIVELRPFTVSFIPQNPDFSGIMNDSVANITNAIREGRDIIGVIRFGDEDSWSTPIMSIVSMDGYEYPLMQWWIVYDGKLGCLSVNETNDPDEDTYSVTTYDITDKAISTTYDAIKDMRDSGNLVKGATYRMTDYVTKINGTYDLSTFGASGYLHIAKSAEHPFDLLLYAIDESHLSEIAKATWHEDDSYFADANVSAWDIRYCIDNDTARFAWADATNGKGVVYWMRDEWGNEAWFDFKNVLNVRYALSASDPNLDTGLAYDASEQPNRYGSPQHQFQALQGYMESGSYNSPFPSPYDFAVGANILGTVQMASLDDTYLSTFNADLYYTFDYFDGAKHIDASLNANAKVPVMENVFDYESDSVVSLLTGSLKPMGLNGSVFETNSVYVSTIGGTGAARCIGNKIGTNAWYNTFGNSCQTNELKDLCYNNIFGNNCDSNTFGNDCNSNTFGNSCDSNTFGDSCNSNTFGYYCYSNTFWNDCYRNTFGNNFDRNTFGNNCDSNTFGDSCDSNTFGNNCDSNTFGDSCNSNTFGNSCDSNTFGDSCNSNTFGNNCDNNTFGNYCYSNTFGNDDNHNELQGYIKFSKTGDSCQYVIVTGGSASTPVMYYTITDAVKGQSGSPLTINALTALERETYVGYNSSGVLKTWCPADLVN